MRTAIDRMPSGGNHYRRGRRRRYHESGGFGDSDSATALHRTGTIRSRRRNAVRVRAGGDVFGLRRLVLPLAAIV